MKVWSNLPDAGQVVLAKVDDASGAVTEAWTGPQVAWRMARGLRRRLRPEDQQPLDLGLALRRLLPRPRQPAAPALDPQPRPARPALVRRLALLLQPGRDLHRDAARLPADALPAGPHGLDRLEGPRKPHPAAVARLGAARRDGLPGRLSLRDEPAGVERDRRRPRRRHRRTADRRGRTGARTGTCPTTRARSAASRTPTATSASGSRRTAAARWRTAAATPTAP